MKERSDHRHRILAKAGRSGSVLALVIILGAVLVLVTMSSLRLTLFANRTVGRSHRHHLALAVAEAGLERAIHEMNQGSVSGSNWSRTETVTSETGVALGQFIVTIAAADTTTPEFESTGYIPTVGASLVSRRVRIGGQTNLGPSFFDWAIYSYEDLKFSSDYFIDSYNSEDGPYPGKGNANSNANLGALGDGELGGNIQVYGSIELGGSITSNTPTVNGDNAEGNPNELIVGSDPTNPPSFPDSEMAAAQASNDNSSITIIDDSGDSDSFSGGTVLYIESNSTAIFPPGDYYFTEVEIGSNVEIRVDPEGEVRFYYENNDGDYFKIGSDLQLNVNTADPKNFLIFTDTPGKLEIASYATIYAALFAPYSYLIVQSDYEWYGAVVGGFVEMQSSEDFHYDESLGNPTGSSGGVLVTSWVEVSPP
jgi:hypothetical protein